MQKNIFSALMMVALAGTAQAQCGSTSVPSDCPPGGITSFTYFSPVCCVADTTTTVICSKYTTTYDAVGCQFTGVVSAVASTYSHATYSETPECDSPDSDTDDATCHVVGPLADLDAGQSSSAIARASASALGVSATHYANMSVSPTSISAISYSNIKNLGKSFYDNCDCEEAGTGAGIGSGFAQATTSGGIGLDCDPGGTVNITRTPSVGTRITNATAARNLDCGPAIRLARVPIHAQLERSIMHEFDAKGNPIASHVDSTFVVEYSDNSQLVLDSNAPASDVPTASSRVVTLSDQTRSLSFEMTTSSSGTSTPTWETWVRLKASEGKAWDDADYDIAADINLNGFVDGADAKLALSSPKLLDMDNNGTTGSDDFMAFTRLLSEGSISADLDMNGAVDAGDLNAWLVAYRTASTQ